MGRGGHLRTVCLAASLAAAWAVLALPMPRAAAQTAVPSPLPEGAGASLGPAGGALRELESLLRAAHFEEVVEGAERLREGLDAAGEGSDLRRLRVRLEVAAGTASVALGRADAARDCFRRALVAEPALDLDPSATAPKVLRAFRSVRAEARSSR